MIVAPFVWLFVAWCKMWQASEGISLAAVAILLLMTFGMGGTGTSDNAHEFIHRPFVWAYWLVGSLAAGRLFSILAARRPQLWTRGVVIGAIVLTLVPCVMARGYNAANGEEECAFPLRVDRGLIDCARYIRNQLPTDAVAQDSQLDNFLILGALNERPSFAARPNLWKTKNAFRESTYQDQLRDWKDCSRRPTFPTCSAVSANWHSLVRDSSRRFQRLADRVSRSPGIRIQRLSGYDMQRAFDLRG